jgi:hypothetical protein
MMAVIITLQHDKSPSLKLGLKIRIALLELLDVLYLALQAYFGLSSKKTCR